MLVELVVFKTQAAVVVSCSDGGDHAESAEARGSGEYLRTTNESCAEPRVLAASRMTLSHGYGSPVDVDFSDQCGAVQF